MNHLNQEFIQEQKNKLIAEEKKLKDMLRQISHVNTRVAGDYQVNTEDLEVGDQPEDEVSKYEETDIRETEVQELELHLRAVGDAIKRIELGTYGICVKTGKPIPRERLVAEPAAATLAEV